jgi:hypothetical protein
MSIRDYGRLKPIHHTNGCKSPQLRGALRTNVPVVLAIQALLNAAAPGRTSRIQRSRRPTVSPR